MNIKKIIITKGIYLDKELRLLVSFGKDDKYLDIINLDKTLIGTKHIATVEKVMKDIDSSILKLSCDQKGFIENSKLNPDEFIEKHSQKKLVCQSDKFYVQITQDSKGTKPYSCTFISKQEYKESNSGFIEYFISKYCCSDTEIITDLKDISLNSFNYKYYNDKDISLWKLYDLTKILNNTLKHHVYLKSGSNIVIESTEALTVIDVNSSKSYGKSNPMVINQEALVAISREIRARSISGIIIVDLLKVSKSQREELVSFSKELFASDISNTVVHGFTNLGLLEITRSRSLAPFTFQLEDNAISS